MGVKVATCNYCGARTALVLRGTDRHELSCAQCGAPLHDMKMMPVSEPKVKTAPVASIAAIKAPKPVKVRKKKRKKSVFQRIVAEVIDEIEDIFD